MRVLHVHSGNLYGGVETILVAIARFARLCPDMESRFALCYEGRLADDLRTASASVDSLGPTRLSRPATVRRARRTLDGVLGRERPDLCICHSSWSRALFQGVIRKRGVPLVLWLHAPVRPRDWLERWAWASSPDFVICNSDFTRSSLRSWASRVPAQTLYCPLDLHTPTSGREAVRQAVRAALGAEPETVLIAHVARMEPGKGHTLLLEALSHLRDRPMWKLLVVGGAQRSSELQYLETVHRHICRAGLEDRVLMLGQRSDVPDLLAAADIYCHPSDVPEGFGIAVVDALNAGLPVVVTALGGVQEIVEPTCGLVAPPGDPDALARALETLITSRATRAHLGSHGPARADALCNPARQITRLSQMLSQSLSQAAGFRLQASGANG